MQNLLTTSLAKSGPLEKAIKAIVKVAKPDKIILFGSRVKNLNDAFSDYDLLVLKRGVKKKRKLVQEIYLNFTNIGAPIDVIVAGLEKFEFLKNDSYLIYKEAAQHGKVVYEKF